MSWNMKKTFNKIHFDCEMQQKLVMSNETFRLKLKFYAGLRKQKTQTEAIRDYVLLGFIKTNGNNIILCKNPDKPGVFPDLEAK